MARRKKKTLGRFGSPSGTHKRLAQDRVSEVDLYADKVREHLAPGGSCAKAYAALMDLRLAYGEARVHILSSEDPNGNRDLVDRKIRGLQAFAGDVRTQFEKKCKVVKG